MIMGRDLCGLPVFSWEEGCYVGRVSDFFIDGDAKVFTGISLGKKFPKKIMYVARNKIKRIYKDGVIITAIKDIHYLRSLGENTISYLDFSKDISIFLSFIFLFRLVQ